MTLSEEDWTERAACKTWHGGHDPRAFYDNESGQTLPVVRKFRARCLTVCPVRVECLETAMRFEVSPLTGEPATYQYRHGIWGGMTPVEREQEGRRRRDDREEG